MPENRRNFETFTYQTTGELRFTGPVTPPDPEEAGWKDTVRAHPQMVTRIIVKFEGYVGRYIWNKMEQYGTVTDRKSVV